MDRAGGVIDGFVRYWWVWIVGVLVAGVITTAAADGFPIVELELAGTSARADVVTRGADLDAIRAAILWDFLLIVFYVLALFFGSLWAGRQYGSRWGRSAGTAIGVGAIVAGVLDIIENLAMLGYLNAWGGWDGWPTLAAVMAIPKFILIAIAIIYILVGIGLALWRSVVRRRQEVS